MSTATVTSKGQITIPAPIRSALGVNAGDRISFVEVDKGRFEVMAATQDIKALKGLVKTEKTVSVDEMNEAVKQRARSLE